MQTIRDMVEFVFQRGKATCFAFGRVQPSHLIPDPIHPPALRCASLACDLADFGRSATYSCAHGPTDFSLRCGKGIDRSSALVWLRPSSTFRPKQSGREISHAALVIDRKWENAYDDGK